MDETETKAGLNGTGGSTMPWFDLSKNGFGEIAERGIARAQERCEQAKALSEDIARAFGEAYASNTSSATDYGLKLIDISKANIVSAIDFASHLLDSRSVADVLTLSATEARKAFDAAAEQNRQLLDLAQKLARDTGEPIRKQLENVLQRAS